MTQSRNVLLLGGPDAGKTNFIFRLWLSVHKSNGLLKADGVPSELTYLEGGARTLVGGHFAPKTPVEEYNKCTIPVRCATEDSEYRGTLVVPDRSGETWKKIYHRREWTTEWDEMIDECCSCLLFVRIDSNQVVTPIDWVTCEKRLGVMLNEAGVGGTSLSEDAEALDNGDTPTEVMIVDWLQFLRKAYTDKMGGAYRPRVGIVVSAWDLLSDDQRESPPGSYIEHNFPLLHQFTNANRTHFDFQIFGLSIVGGDFDRSEGFRSDFLNGDPGASGYVVVSINGDVRFVFDITLPVAWAMGVISDLKPSQ